ncbi:hypothetical protein HPP92_009255 [Vanilla planifolia]|uniref:Secreted protein n=1 Tax=Vanilla planifolia TaxID=51239 RepID=A0A835R9N4_VANPL|nr:hypothetical protein HPP92_009255 [Vanilla planifolia]
MQVKAIAVLAITQVTFPLVVNCVQCHPCDCAVATGSIDNTIKHVKVIDWAYIFDRCGTPKTPSASVGAAERTWCLVSWK